MKQKLAIAAPCIAIPYMMLSPTWAAPVAAVATVLGLRWIPRMGHKHLLDDAKHAAQELPLALDVIALSLEAGISWDRAARLAAVGCSSSLRHDLEGAAGRLAMGASAEEAWQGSGAARVVREVVVRSGRSGAAVSDIFRQQADGLRSERRMERLMRVKQLDSAILIPLTLLGIPAFIVLSTIPTGISMFSTMLSGFFSTGSS